MIKRETNSAIKKAISKAGLYHWEVFTELGISEATWSRRMRQELNEKDKQNILSIIKAIKDREDEKK